MANDNETKDVTAEQQCTDTAAQVESVMEKILEDHAHLRAVRDALRDHEEPGDNFAREFLRGFRQRLKS